MVAKLVNRKGHFAAALAGVAFDAVSHAEAR